jgi:hypothetical protein
MGRNVGAKKCDAEALEGSAGDRRFALGDGNGAGRTVEGRRGGFARGQRTSTGPSPFRMRPVASRRTRLSGVTSDQS